MNPERWRQVRDLLTSALELEAAERSTFLDQHCSSDPALRQELEKLLSVKDEVPSSFLGMAALEEAALQVISTSENSKIATGMRHGPYQAQELLGAGGMGQVYRAFRADDQYRKQVAVKVVRHGQNFSGVLERFKNERQILADLDHPNIARLLDGGTTEVGDPFFVMEMIEGLPIDDYCDRNILGIIERLKLFCQVCSAVEYAHRHLIVHRDIKPSNILVTSDGVPKLLDFGIAKILDETSIDAQTEPTLTMFRALTPGYASPEQVTGASITTASDVYSLGVILYELLTGRSPYQLSTRTAAELGRAVCETEPERLSLVVSQDGPSREDEVIGKSALETAAARHSSPEKLSKQLRGDLDNIVLMALRKEPQRRYGSVEQFAQDIRWHLTNLPVKAQKDTLRYRATKFVTRHKTGVFATALTGLTMLTALVLLIRANRITRQQSEIAKAERVRAERRFNDIRQLANVMIFDMPQPIHALPGSVAVEKMLYDNGLRFLDALAAEAGDDASLQRELAAGYKQLADSMGSPYSSSLGDWAGAMANYRRALQMREIIAGKNPTNAQDRIDLAKIHRTLGYSLERAGDLSAARAEVLKALDIIRPVAEAHSDNIYALNELSVGYLTLGFVDREGLGNEAIAVSDYINSFEVVEKIANKKHDFVAAQMVYMLAVLSQAHTDAGKPSEAIEYARRAVQDLYTLEHTGPASEAHLAKMAGVHEAVGNTLLFAGRYREAASEYKKELFESKVQFDPRDYNSLAGLADAYVHEGHGLEIAGDAEAGLQAIKRGIELQVPAEKTLSENYVTASIFALSYLYEGEALEHLGRFSDAQSAYEKVVELSHLPALAEFPRTKLMTATGLASAARMLAKLGRSDNARNNYKEALSLIEPAATSKPPDPTAQYVMVDVYAGLGDVAIQHSTRSEHRRNDRNDICQWYRKSADMWQQLSFKSVIAPNGFKVMNYSEVPGQLVSCQQPSF